MSDTPLSLLVVDPNGLASALVADALGADGHARVERCLEYADACDEAARVAPTLVVVDLGAPFTWGLDAIRDLRHDPRTAAIPVLALVPPGDQGLAPMAFQLGAADVASKQMHPAELAARARRLAAARRTVEERDAAWRVLELVSGELALKNALLARTSTVDPLTGLASRRAFEEYLAAQWQEAAEGGRPLGVVLVEVNSWQRIEATGGPDVADELLQVVARLLRSCARPRTDVLARFGDAQFAFLLRETGPRGVATIARRVVETMDLVALHADRIALLPRATVSVGGGSAWPTHGERPELLIARADEALTYALYGSGNRYELYDGETQPAEDERRIA
ncbi:MAG: diguanylate cyclase [Deltaproteobacteria bacterium]|nr:diguanylate cyclase [Deltaproteobacteria bacterium]MCB9787538.1 diguanylate cyclase [Deltaproteobacteria bacterium]